MLRIRLCRTGARHQPSYRIVVADSRSPRNGKFKEIIGHYNPVPNPPVVEIDQERAAYWMARGALPSEAVARFVKKQAAPAAEAPKAVEAEAAPVKSGEGG
jgi:small subunit ribosomal protein S16